VQERIRRRDELDATVRDWVGGADAATVPARLDAVEVPCGAVNSVRDLSRDPQVRARESIVEFPSQRNPSLTRGERLLTIPAHADARAAISRRSLGEGSRCGWGPWP
jgi:crotonobetainyl-CoA:carnitine CoA-transferase CaiB-like acyl-CoA transferase